MSMIDALRKAAEEMRKLRDGGAGPAFLRPTHWIVPDHLRACATCTHPLPDHQGEGTACARIDCTCKGWVTP